MTENKNQPAFPVLELKEMGDKFLLDCAAAGVSKREYFAAKAMQGFISNSTFFQGYSSNADMARQAVEMADTLLAELSKS